ncbi:hypothetical protein HZS_5604 [Henneguya salminicola]|nr:hypothetical protein HZS_5604 [Henneguya salminicola]
MLARKLKELRILKVDFNQLKTLPDSICELNNLTDFYISGNSLSCFPEQFGKLKSLRCLHADYNVLCSLPDSICECKELSIFSLRDNWIEVLPTNIGNLSKLTVLDLSGNKLKFLPFSVSKLKKIRAIWLSKTQQKSMYALQTDNDSQYGKVLTNFLLPQRSSKHSPTSSFIDTDNESNHQRERKWRPSECYAAEKKTSIFKSENVDDDQSQTMTNKINELCLLVFIDKNKSKNSVKDLDSKLSEDIKQQKNVHFEIETIEDFSIDYVKYYTDTIGSYGIEIEELDTINLNTFGTSESSIIIKKIHPDSSADRLNKLREGDRILEINEISLTNLPLKAALPLLQLKGLELDLLIRHDPPLAHFKKIIIDRENGNIKLGLGVKRMPLTQKSSIQLLTIFNLDDAVPQIETNLKLDDIIIEVTIISNYRQMI